MERTAGEFGRRSAPARLAAAVLPALLFGLRMTAAVLLALYIAFALELDMPSWAGTSAGIVCTQVLGSSLRKAAFRMVGTAVGAVATVCLTAAFPQDRIGFLVGLSLWCGLCSFVSTLLRNFAAYAAMLAGYTMAIIASSSMDAPDQVFTLAVDRATEIGLGIVTASIVLSLTGRRLAPQQLADRIARAAGEIDGSVRAELGAAGGVVSDTRAPRRTLLREIAGFDALIDQAAGESAELRYRSGQLHAARDALYAAVSAWRILAVHLAAMAPAAARADAAPVRAALSAAVAEGGDAYAVDYRAMRALAAIDSPNPSVRLLSHACGRAMLNLARAWNGVRLIRDPARARALPAAGPEPVGDLLPAAVNGLRVAAGLAVASCLWVLTAWPSGPTAITFVAVTMLLQAPRFEEGMRAAVGFGLGTALAAVIAALVNFAMLPNREGFLSFALVIAAWLVPLGALSTLPHRSGLQTATAMNFIPLLGPSNVASINTLAFYNSALAIVLGCALGSVMLRVLPALPPAMRTRRLLAAARRDLARLAKAGRPQSSDRWQRRLYGRLTALPAEAGLADGSRLVAVLTVGLQVIRLRRAQATPGCADAIRAVLDAIAALDMPAVADALGLLEGRLAQAGAAGPDWRARARLGAACIILRETLAAHGDYLGGDPPDADARADRPGDENG